MKDILAKNIRSLRTGAGMTQKKAAELVGAKLRNYQAYEEARAVPPLETLVSIAHVFSVTVDDLLSKTYVALRKSPCNECRFGNPKRFVR